MPRLIPANQLLLHCGQPLTDDGSESREGLFRYASSAVKALLKEEITVYEKLKLSVFDGVLSGRHTVAELTEKKYPHAPEQLCAKLMPCVLLDLLTKGKPLFIYKISTDSCDMPLLQITAELFGNVQGMEKLALKKLSSRRSPFPFGLKRRTEELRLKVSVSIMRSAFDDLRFISRYNEETFFRGVPEPSSPIIDLSDKSVRNGFTMLYAMTFFGFSAEDLFTVDSVFGFTDIGVRSKDDMRPKAAAELFHRIKQDDIDGLAEMVDEMGAKLMELPLPDLNVNDPITLAQNCTLYAGLAQIGKAYIAALSPVETVLIPDASKSSYKAAKQRAGLLSQYDHALTLCQGVLTLLTMKKPQLSSLKGYSQALQLQQLTEKEIR